MNIDEGPMQKFVKEEEVVCQFAKLLTIVLVPSEFDNLLPSLRLNE